jgi:hypothetical protein
MKDKTRQGFVQGLRDVEDFLRGENLRSFDNHPSNAVMKAAAMAFAQSIRRYMADAESQKLLIEVGADDVVAEADSKKPMRIELEADFDDDERDYIFGTIVPKILLKDGILIFRNREEYDAGG